MKRGANDQLTAPKPKRAKKAVFQVIRHHVSTVHRTTTLRMQSNGRLTQRKKDTHVALPQEKTPTPSDLDDTSLNTNLESSGLQPCDPESDTPKARKRNTTTVG